MQREKKQTAQIGASVKDAGGVSYGSRWSERSERPPVRVAQWYTTPAGVTEKCYAAWYLLRDPAGVVKIVASAIPVVARFARTTGYRPSHLRWLGS
jgi:hypothetical protein